ncbi:MAG TPA: hypothetical protein VJS44_08445 [Pyrinomonadaceae bacterium]|nr:hypothetical protein [Pyrinomonadaceae bacterium]
MTHFNGSAVLTDDTVMTLQELLQAAITARTFPSAQQRTDMVNRFVGGRTIVNGFMHPMADIYMMDAYKGVRNGVTIAADWTTPDDFTDEPGGGELLEGDLRRHFDHPIDIGNRVLYQNTGADVVIYFDVTLS